ncbi:MAG: N-formylglutamate amidohydrolase [Alphaproteobacteria bacterium]
MARTLLTPMEPAAFRWFNKAGRTPLLFVCDHASRRIPQALGTLGLEDTELARHIGWDIGAAAVTESLATTFDAPAILTGYSRLVVDCNRSIQDADSIPEVSDGTRVPGNIDLSALDRQQRVFTLFEPYHTAIDQALTTSLARDEIPTFISVHSCTPVMAGRNRPWHIGVLSNRDLRIAAPLIESLAAEDGLVIGDNEPYSGKSEAGYTIRAHAEKRGLPHVMLEIRQDLIADAPGVHHWARVIERALRQVLSRCLMTIAHPPDKGVLR